MIRIEIRSRNMNGYIPRKNVIEVDAAKAELAELARKKFQWQIDYTQATPEEIACWRFADFSTRMTRAVLDGKQILLDGADANFETLNEIRREKKVAGFEVVVDNPKLLKLRAVWAC